VTDILFFAFYKIYNSNGGKIGGSTELFACVTTSNQLCYTRASSYLPLTALRTSVCWFIPNSVRGTLVKVSVTCPSGQSSTSS